MDVAWIKYCAVGELLGFAAAAMFNYLHLQFIGEPTSLFAVLLILLLAALGGLAEGGILAWFQYQRLQHYIPSLRLRFWQVYTAGIAAVCWLLGMSFPTIMAWQDPVSDSSSGGTSSFDPALWQVGLLGLGLGVFLGAIFGIAQAQALRPHISNAQVWIMGNIAAWACAMTVLMIGPSIVPQGAGIGLIVAIAAISGLLAGLVIGVVLMFFLDRLELIDRSTQAVFT